MRIWPDRYRKKHADYRAEQAAHLASAFAPSTADGIPPELIQSYMGTYQDYAYGNVSICPSPSSVHASQPSLPSACSALHKRLAGILSTDNTPPPSPRALLIAAPACFGMSHIVLEHDIGESWKGIAASVFGGVEGREKGLLVYDGGEQIRVDLSGRNQAAVWGIWGAGSTVAKRTKEQRKTGNWGEPEVVFARV